MDVGLRFGCGAMVGVAIVGTLGLRLFLRTDGAGWAVAGVAALVCGLVAVRGGDKFFRQAMEWFPSRRRMW